MKSQVVKRSIVIATHKTSVSLEDAFWNGLKEIAAARNVALSDLVSSIDAARKHGNLSSALRLFVLDYYRSQAGLGGARGDGGIQPAARGHDRVGSLRRRPDIIHRSATAAKPQLRRSAPYLRRDPRQPEYR